MKRLIILIVAVVLASCSQDTDSGGIMYSGIADLNTRLHQFTATNADSGEDVIITMTGPRELTFNLNDKLSHIDYENDVIIIKSETDSSEWAAKSVKGGFELEDGTRLQYDDCQGWAICLQEKETNLPILKGKYALRGNSVEITLWISDQEKHAELLALMANALFNRSKNANESVESALETLSNQVWTY